jgi:hypothetical protein
MSTEKEKLNILIGRVEEILTTMDKLTAELRSLSASMKSLAVAQITASVSSAPTVKPATKPASVVASASKPAPTVTATPESTPTPAPMAPKTGEKKRTIEDIKMSFPEELEVRLSFEEKGDYIIIKPKQFLGSDNFAKIASAVRAWGANTSAQAQDRLLGCPKEKLTYKPLNPVHHLILLPLHIQDGISCACRSMPRPDNNPAL